LHELHRARAVVPCDWQLDMAAGAGLILPHVDKAVELSRVALLRARQRFASGETDAALSDVLAVFKLARDCGSSPLVISMYVDSAIEESATDVLKSPVTFESLFVQATDRDGHELQRNKDDAWEMIAYEGIRVSNQEGLNKALGKPLNQNPFEGVRSFISGVVISVHRTK
jgi:hypothetical protein